MATLQSLPPELIHRTLELGAASLESYPERTAFLLSASLVSSSWRAHAQALLWKRVEINSWGSAMAFLASGRKGRTTASLVEKGPGNHPLAGELVDACEGLRELSLSSGILKSDVFLRSSKLQGLTSLTLNDVSFQSIQTPSTPFPFGLSSLSIDLRSHLPTPDSFAHLLQPSIHSLSLTFFQPTLHLTPPHLLSLLTLGPNLTSLSLIHADSTPSTTLRPFLATCLRLSHLSCHLPSASSNLPFLPAQL